MTRKIVLIHIPFTLGYRPSGGGVRPQKIIEAFKRLGNEVEVISGTHKERSEKFKELFKRIEKAEIDIDFVYSEAPANPTILTDKYRWWQFRDFYYLIKLHNLKIPIGLFYRDIHWNVKGIFDYGPVKKAVLHLLHILDLVFYTFFVDVFFLPTERMAPFIPLANFFKRDELPPGHDVHELLPLKELSFPIKAMFVGGILPPVYNISSLFTDKLPYELTICCREDEWKAMSSYYGKVPQNISVVHLSGAELRKEYSKQQLFLMIRQDHQYLVINQPIKLYEALGFELPILISPGSLASDIVKELDIGWVTDNSDLKIERSDYHQKLENIRKIKSNYTWDSRVKYLISVLKPLKSSKY